jgi:hypothetical protein
MTAALVWTQAAPGGDWRAATPAMSADGAEYRITLGPDGLWDLFIATPSTLHLVAGFPSLLGAQAEAARTAR